MKAISTSSKVLADEKYDGIKKYCNLSRAYIAGFIIFVNKEMWGGYQAYKPASPNISISLDQKGNAA